MLCEDVYVKYTDKAGKSFVSYHRVWDKQRFLDSLASCQIVKDGGHAVQTTRPKRRNGT